MSIKDLRLRNENDLVQPKSTLLQPRTKREAGGTRGIEKSSTEGRKGRKGKKFLKKQQQPRRMNENGKMKKRIRGRKKSKNVKNKKTNTEKKSSRGRKQKQRIRKQKSRNGGKKIAKQDESFNFSSCVDVMKIFASRIKKAANIERQAKRIEAFKKIIDKKKTKV